MILEIANLMSEVRGICEPYTRQQVNRWSLSETFGIFAKSLYLQNFRRRKEKSTPVLFWIDRVNPSQYNTTATTQKLPVGIIGSNSVVVLIPHQ